MSKFKKNLVFGAKFTGKLNLVAKIGYVKLKFSKKTNFLVFFPPPITWTGLVTLSAIEFYCFLLIFVWNKAAIIVYLTFFFPLLLSHCRRDSSISLNLQAEISSFHRIFFGEWNLLQQIRLLTMFKRLNVRNRKCENGVSELIKIMITNFFSLFPVLNFTEKLVCRFLFSFSALFPHFLPKLSSLVLKSNRFSAQKPVYFDKLAHQRLKFPPPPKN